jgi:SAM-dependent methyltransferase
MRHLVPERFRRALRRMVKPPSYKVVKELEARRAGLFHQATGELAPGFAIGGDDVFVDVGCGTGAACGFAAVWGGAEVYGIDIDPGAIETLCRNMAVTPTPRPVHAIVSDSNPLPLPDALATRVVCQEVLEHVDDPRQVMCELVRIGRPGARYLLSVPDPAGEAVQKALAPEAYWRRPNHLRVFGRDEFDALVRDAGLRIEDRSRFGFYWTMWWTLYWQHGRGNDLGAPLTPLLKRWNQTWAALLACPEADRVREALDEAMPKSQILIARKAA